MGSPCCAWHFTGGPSGQCLDEMYEPPRVRLKIVPSKPVAPTKCKCTPATCGCKQKKVDKPR